MKDSKRRLVWNGLPVNSMVRAIVPAMALVVVLTMAGLWLGGCSPHARDKSFAKEHPLAFAKLNSGGEAMLQLDACLLHYAMIQRDDVYPDDLDSVGPNGSGCTYAASTDFASRLNYRFAYFPANRDAKEKPHGFLLYAYPLLTKDGRPITDSTSAEYFADENGIVLYRRDFGTSKEHIEPFLGLPKTLQVLSSKLAGKSLPTDQTGMLSALGPEGSPGYSSVPKGYQGLWTAADNDAAAVWTNMSEGYLYSYRPEHGAAPTHFTLLARPVYLGISGVDPPIRRLKHYFLNETGGIHETFLDREATALDPEVPSCERLGENCEQLWISPPASSTGSP